jgi:chromosome segregation ATPase
VALSNKEAEVVDLLQQIQSLQNPSNTSSVDNPRDAVSAAKKYYDDLQKQLEDERKKVVGLNGQLTALEADHELKIKALKNDKAELESRISELSTLRQGDAKKIADLTEDLRKVTAEKDSIVDELDEKDDTIARYQVALSNKEAETIDLAQQMQFQEDRNAAEVKRLNQSIALGVKTIEELQKQLEEERKKIADLEEDLSSQVSILQLKVKSLSNDKVELEKNIIDLRFSLDSERKRAVELNDDLQKTDAKLAVLQIKLDDKDAEIKRYQVALTNKEAEMVDLLQQLQSLKDQIAADAKKFQDALSAERKSKDELQKQLVDEQRKVVALKEQLASESAEHEEKVKSLLMDKSALELKVSQLELSNERHRNQIAELNDELLKGEARLKSLQVKLGEKDAEIASYQVALSNKEAEVVDLLQQIQSLQNPSNTSSVDNPRDEALSAAKKYYDDLQKQLEDERKKVVGLNGQLTAQEADYELKIKALKNDKAELESRNSELSTFHQSDAKKIADLTEDLRKVTAEKDSLITELDEKDDMIARYQVALSNKEAESLELTLQMKTLEDRLTVEVKKLNDAISADKKVIDELRKQLDDERKKISDLKDDMRSQIASLEQKIKSLLIDKADLEKKVSLLQLEIDRGTQRNVELSDDVKKADNRIKSLQDKLDDKQTEIKRYQVALTNKEAEMVDLLQQLQSLKDQIAADAKKFQDALSAERKSKDELQKQLVDEQRKVVALKEQLASESAEHEEKVNSLLKDTSDLENRVSEKDSAIEVLDGRIKELNDELKKVVLEKEAISSQLIERDDTIALYKVALNNKEAESLELTLQMKILEDQHTVEVKKLNDAISSDKKIIEELQKQLDEERTNFDALKNDLSAQLVALETRIKSLLVDKEELADILSDEVKVNEQKQKTIDDLTDELMKAQTQNKLLRLQLDEKDAEIARYQVALSNKEAEVVDLLQQIQSLQNPSNTSSVDNSRDAVSAAKKYNDDLQKQLDDERKKADALKSQSASKEVEYEAIIKALKNDKSVLEEKISDIEQVVKEHEKSIASLEEDLRVDIAQKNALQALLDSKNGVISGYQVALSNKEAEYLELMQQISSLKEMLLEEEGKLRDLKSSEQIARDKLQQELDIEMKKSIAAKDQQLSDKADFESKIKSLQKDKSDLDNRISDMESQLQQKDKENADLNDDISKLQAQLKSVTAQLEEKKVEIARYQVALSNKEAEMIDLTQQIQSVKEQHAHEVTKLNEVISSEKKTIDDLQKLLDEERAKAVALEREQLNEKIKVLTKDKADLEQLLSESNKTNTEINDDLKKADSQNKYLKAQHEFNVQELSAKDIEIARYQVMLSNKEAETVDLTQQVQSALEAKAVETKRLSVTIAADKKVNEELEVQLDEGRKKIAELKELLSTKEAEYEDKLRNLVDEKSELDELMLEIDKVSKGQISQLKDTSKQLDIQNKSIGNQLEEKKQEIARYQVVLSNKEAEVLDLTQQIQSLKQQHAVEVKKLNDAISADKKVIDGLQKQLDEERKTIADLKELVASKDAELVQKMSSLIDDQTELENRIAEYQSRILDLGDYSQKLEQQFLSVNSQLEEKIREITRYQAALSNKEAESQELVQQLRILRDGQSSETKTDLSPLGGVVQLLQ